MTGRDVIVGVGLLLALAGGFVVLKGLGVLILGVLLFVLGVFYRK